MLDDELVDNVIAGPEPIPPPQVRSRPATRAEMPPAAATLGKAARKEGFTLKATYSRGPRLDQYWKVVEISDCVVVRGWHEDGRRFVAAWITKTGQRGKSEGVVKWDFELGYCDGLMGRCTINPIKAYCKQPRQVSTT